MNKIKIMDCTLRDGGYVNNWNFGEKCIQEIPKALCEAQIEYIEGGFLSQIKQTNKDMSIFSTISMANNFFASCNHEIALMINCGEYNPQDIEKYEGGNVTTIRIAFHKHQINEAQILCSVIQEKGYKVFFQPMVTTGYTDQELLQLIEWANQNMPEAFYIVDSFGTMRKNDVLRMFYLIDNNLKKEIKIGFHSHNNLQLSFSNAQELMSLPTKREIIIDSSVFGMGRGAGNLCTELLSQYINENIEKKYSLIPILETMDEFILPIYMINPWGYSAPYYVAAINGCHPNYATYLMDKQTLCIRDINIIIKNIPIDKKQLYKEEIISELYKDYQEHNVNDSMVIADIQKDCENKEVLILAPGKSLLTHKEKIKMFIKEHHPIIYAINHIPEIYAYDTIFISNLKRFKGIDDVIAKIGDKVICTSNINNGKVRNVINYSQYLNEEDIISDNAGLMLINILKKAGIKKLYLAGYDGFSSNENLNYYDEKLNLNIQNKKRQEMNEAMIQYFQKIRKNIEIVFLTPTLYDR